MAAELFRRQQARQTGIPHGRHGSVIDPSYQFAVGGSFFQFG
jgi:hypothetical protein